MITAHAAWERWCAERREWGVTYASWCLTRTEHEIDEERARGPRAEAVPTQETC